MANGIDGGDSSERDRRVEIGFPILRIEAKLHAQVQAA
jgi:hypothetical protein